MNLSSYALRNRCLRYGKRYRYYMSLNGHHGCNYQWYYKLLSYIFLSAIMCLTIFWVFIFKFNQNQNSSLNHDNVDIDTFDHNRNLEALEKFQLNQFYQKERYPKTFYIERYVKVHETNESQLGMINNESDSLKKEMGFQQYAFNSLVSERLGFHRFQVPDTRHDLCRNHTIDDEHIISAYNTSVIICFFNEEFHTLIRTVNSILDRTPQFLLAEILLIDDFSENDLKSKIDEYRTKLIKLFKDDFLKKVRYIRTPERLGLIRSRNYGAQFATGKVLFFLDSHCEVNVDWLPPILERIARNRTTVACPIIDLIDPDTFIYKPSPMVRGGFNWALHFKWDSIPNEELSKKSDFIKPIKSPAMAGGLFSIDREYFFQLGSYDSGMNIWGAENIEFSLRIWMCGGQLEIIPCSRVGHIFRKRRPYDSPDGQDTLAYNSLRVANVWLDDYKKYYLKTRSDLAKMPYGNVQDRIQLRKKLNCKSFKWYLQNVYPQLLEPPQKSMKTSNKNLPQNHNLFTYKLPKLIDKYLLQLNGTDLCIESESELSYKNTKLHLAKCSRTIRRQIWKQSELDELRMGNKGCLDSGSQGKMGLVRLNKCHEMGGTQKWTHQSKNLTNIYNVGAGTCLAIKSLMKQLKDLNDFVFHKMTNEVLLNHDKIQINSEDHYSLPYKIVMYYCKIPGSSAYGSDHQLSSISEFNIFNLWNLIPLVH